MCVYSGVLLCYNRLTAWQAHAAYSGRCGFREHTVAMAEHDLPADADYLVGVTGHRTLNDPDMVARACRDLLEQVLREHPTAMACSALAVGADTTFAEVALALGMSLLVVVPFARFLEDFASTEEQAHYQRLRASAARVIDQPFTERSDDAYLAGGVWIANHVDLLVAIWDGESSRGRGGTADIVARARARGVPVRVITATRQGDVPAVEMRDEPT